MAILFENCPVTINGVNVYATSASVDQGISTDNLKAMGASNMSVLGTDAPRGNFSADFIIHDQNLISSMTGLKNSDAYFTCIAGPYTANNCLLSSFSLAAEPNSVVTASFSAEVLGEIEEGSVPAASTASVTGAHTSQMTSDFSNVGYSDKTFSFSYDLSQNYNLIYSLTGGFIPAIKTVEGGEESVSIEGDNIAVALTGVNGAVCLDQLGTMELTFKDECGRSKGSLSVNGYITSRDISIGENDIVRGTANITNPY